MCCGTLSHSILFFEGFNTLSVLPSTCLQWMGPYLQLIQYASHCVARVYDFDSEQHPAVFLFPVKCNNPETCVIRRIQSFIGPPQLCCIEISVIVYLFHINLAVPFLVVDSLSAGRQTLRLKYNAQARKTFEETKQRHFLLF